MAKHVQTLFTSTADASVANTVAEASLIGSGIGSKTLAANFFKAGTTIRIRIGGIMSDTGTPTLNIRLKFGSTAIISTGAEALTGTISDNYWEAEIYITCRTAGATGTFIASGEFTYDTANHDGKMEGMSHTGTATVDTTAAITLDVTATWGAASASNTITGQLAEIEVLN